MPIPLERFRGGFTIIEITVYVGLFSLLSVIIINTMWSTIRISNELRVSRDINDSAVVVMERLTRDIRNATQIDLAYSAFATSPGRLTLQTVTASGTAMTIEYFVASSTLRIKENGIDKGSLLSTRSQIDGLVFYYISRGATTAIKTELHIKSVRGASTNLDHFYNTTILRGTY